MGHITLLAMVVLSAYWDTFVSKLRLGVSQLGSADGVKGSPWARPVAQEAVD